MVLAQSASMGQSAEPSRLLLTNSPDGKYVQELYMGDLGITLNFGPPKALKVTKLTKLQPATTAMPSASGRE